MSKNVSRMLWVAMAVPCFAMAQEASAAAPSDSGMGAFAVFEILLIIAVVALQVRMAYTTYRQIVRYRRFLSNADNLSLEQGKFFIRRGAENSALLQKVLATLNRYLEKNCGAAADFHLIKDIVERHCDAVDEEISQRLPVPLYLGLMGTVAGIIVGLFSLDGNVDSANFVHSIGSLIGGIKFAMICSLVGLGLTTYLSAIAYRGAKADLERQKNELYNLIQTTLLPRLNENAATTILNFQRGLKSFNEDFAANVTSFGGIMSQIHDALDSQVNLMHELKKMDIAQIARVNSSTLSELRQSMTEFEKFTRYLSQMNSFVLNTARLTDAVTDQLQRTEMVQTIAGQFERSIEGNRYVMEKLRAFLERVDEHKALISASAEVGEAVRATLDELRDHVRRQIASIQLYTTEATAQLEHVMHQERAYLDKLGNLDELGGLVRAVEGARADAKAQNVELGKLISALAMTVHELRKMPGGGGGRRNDVLSHWTVELGAVLVALSCIVYLYTTLA